MLWILALVALTSVMVGIFYPQIDYSEFALLTDDQIKLYLEVQKDNLRDLEMVTEEGPYIDVKSPVGYRLNSPLRFEIDITPREDAPVDMATFRIAYRLGDNWLDVTRKMLKQGDVEGSRVSVPGALLPVGQHAMRFKVSDSKKRQSETTVTFSVGE
ncbi:MAG: hypothetical protein ACU0FH_24030 [Heliomarina sp.]|uniref:hypothetical protein n=1 Tax=Heliomarina sp. TaxID=2917556 RepID=UPI004058BA3D